MSKKTERPKKPRARKTPEQRRRQANRRQRLWHIVGRVFFMAVLVSAAVLALTIFFKVDEIEVVGNTKYSSSEIAAGLGIDKGDNLYLWNKIKASDEMTEQFPYLESVLIRRHLPDKLVVTVTECTPALAVPSDGGYYYLSGQGKVLELAAEDGGLPVAVGVTLMGAQPGQMVSQTADAYTDALMRTIDALREGGLMQEVTFINLQSLTDIRIGYQGRFDLRVGTVEEIAYRVRFARTVIEERLSPSDIGRLYWDSKKRLHFVPDSAENVARSATLLDDVQTPAQLDPAADSGQLTGEPDGGADSGEDGAGGAAEDSAQDAADEDAAQ